MDYGNKHRMFLQYMVANTIVLEEDAKASIIRIFSHNDIFSVIAVINKELNSLNMMIKSVTCEITGETYLAFVSTVLDELAKHQKSFTTAQLELLRTVFTEIKENNGCLSSTECLNLHSWLNAKITKGNAEQFLNIMVQKQWLYEKDGRYYIGVRSIAELMPYFRATYNNSLNSCPFCKQVIFYGKRCTHCQCTMHLHCVQRYEMTEKLEKCLSCNNVLLTDVENDNEEQESTQRRRRKKRNTQQHNIDVTDSD